MNALRLPKVKEKLGLARTQIYEQINAGLIPKPIKITGKASAWLDSELEAVLKARAAGWDEDRIRAMVRRLEDGREKLALEAYRAT